MSGFQAKFRNFLNNFTFYSKSDFIYKTIPAVGAVSYCIYSTKFLVPQEFSR